ncbi:MAG TPA: hypothetical protein VIN57_03985 [Magnetovibrio sp.]
MNKRTALRLYTIGLFIFILFWWPLSHWFYPGWYHTLLGFQGYDDGLVKVIGTMGLFPLLLLGYAARRPENARAFLAIFMTWSVGMVGTYLYLIMSGVFPAGEYINVGLLLGNLAVMTWLLPPQTVITKEA